MAIIVDNVQFPRSIARLARGSGLKFKNRLIQGEGGDLTSVAVWERNLGEWSIESTVWDHKLDSLGVTNTELWEVVHLFAAAMGQGTGFLFQPWGDCSFLDGTKVTVGSQVYKRYDNSIRTFDRPVIQDPEDANKFLVPVMFAMDELDFEVDDWQIVSLPSIKLVEVANYTLNE